MLLSTKYDILKQKYYIEYREHNEDIEISWVNNPNLFKKNSTVWIATWLHYPLNLYSQAQATILFLKCFRCLS